MGKGAPLQTHEPRLDEMPRTISWLVTELRITPKLRERSFISFARALVVMEIVKNQTHVHILGFIADYLLLG